MPKHKLILIAILVIVISQVFLVIKFPAFFEMKKDSKQSDRSKTIKYVPIGDSYTIGLGVLEDERWPNILVRHLNEKGIPVVIADNPSISGYTVRSAIDDELPVVERVRPDFVTVFLGANDNFAQKPVGEFRNDLTELLDKLQLILDKPRNIVLVTIPDYSKTPAINDGANDELLNFIEEYNQVINELALKKGLKVADIFAVSQSMTEDEYYTEDGLHPSALGYIKWERVIYPMVLDQLKD